MVVRKRGGDILTKQGIVISLKPFLSHARLESGRLIIWHDRTINRVLQRAIKAERRGDDLSPQNISSQSISPLPRPANLKEVENG